jgi:LemA protein
MKKTLIIVGIALFILIALPLMIVKGNYNRFVTLEEGVDAQWANVETVLQRRFDLIPNLVNTVKGFAEHEKDIFTEVTKLRSQWASAGNANEKVGVANEMQGAMGRLMLVAENYPQLKSNQNFLALQEELAGTENRISVERRRYNDSVRGYNTAIRKFPGILIANSFGFEKREVFQASPGAEIVPTVSF